MNRANPVKHDAHVHMEEWMLLTGTVLTPADLAILRYPPEVEKAEAERGAATATRMEAENFMVDE